LIAVKVKAYTLTGGALAVVGFWGGRPAGKIILLMRVSRSGGRRGRGEDVERARRWRGFFMGDGETRLLFHVSMCSGRGGCRHVEDWAKRVGELKIKKDGVGQI
jgi:hypothetical protein